MQELELKYGCNPNQMPAKIFMRSGEDVPVQILNGRPGYINFLDAFNGWQLVRELKAVLGLPAATTFKHVSPTSAAIGLPLDAALKRACFVDDVPELDASPLACAYARARGTDRLCAFGDWTALSDVCDATTAQLVAKEVSDGIIAPGYTPEALEILKAKRGGNYSIVQIDPDYAPGEMETREVFGVTFVQRRNDIVIDRSLLDNIVTHNKNLPEQAKRDLIVAMITLKYTQSNAVCLATDGQVIGVGAGQQSRIHCTRLASNKADTWRIRQHPKVLDLPFLPTIGRPERDNVIDSYINGGVEDVCAPGYWPKYFTCRPQPLSDWEKRAMMAKNTNVVLASDAFFPFPDNVEQAQRSGVRYIAQPGGSIRDDLVIAACEDYDMVMAFTGTRLFTH